MASFYLSHRPKPTRHLHVGLLLSYPRVLSAHRQLAPASQRRTLVARYRSWIYEVLVCTRLTYTFILTWFFRSDLTDNQNTTANMATSGSDRLRDHWKCIAACTLVSMCPFQYGVDFGIIGGLQAMPGFLEVRIPSYSAKASDASAHTV